MRDLAQFLARHPRLTGTLFGITAGACAYNAYLAGVSFAHAATWMDRTRAASEMLGG